MINEEMKQLLTFQKVGDMFKLEGLVKDYSAIKSGLINKTYKIEYDTGKKYIFQCINQNVFKDPFVVMKNIDIVTEHIRAKYPDRKNIHFHHTFVNTNYYVADDKTFWRVINFFDGISYDASQDLNIFTELGAAIGEFQKDTSDIDGILLKETIPDFHNTKKRLDTLFSNPNIGKRMASEEKAYIKEFREYASEISELTNKGELPLRICHNDTKLNNILFEKDTNKHLVVIDLDTVMPGCSLNDIADCARYSCNETLEDEIDTSLVEFNLEKFEALLKGYSEESKQFLTKKEIDLIPQAVFSMTIELASRFLDDYLNGNVYFHCAYKHHNLIRARNQIALAKDIYQKMGEMKKIVEKYYL